MSNAANVSAECLTPILYVRDFTEAMNYYTEKTLVYIQELKTKHGIDYDTHASYQFTEKSSAG